jgi:ketosteroid isomerase-like protein
MAHPNEEVLRAAYAEFSKGNIEGFLSYCAPEVQFHTRGDNALAGDYDRTTFLSLVGKLFHIAGPSLRVEVTGILADDARGVVFLKDVLTRVDTGKSHEVSPIHVFHFENGRITRFDELSFDQRLFDEAWAPIQGAAQPVPVEAEPVEIH